MKKSLYTLSALVVMTGISQAATLWTTTFSNAASDRCYSGNLDEYP